MVFRIASWSCSFSRRQPSHACPTRASSSGIVVRVSSSCRRVVSATRVRASSRSRWSRGMVPKRRRALSGSSSGIWSWCPISWRFPMRGWKARAGSRPSRWTLLSEPTLRSPFHQSSALTRCGAERSTLDHSGDRVPPNPDCVAVLKTGVPMAILFSRISEGKFFSSPGEAHLGVCAPLTRSGSAML